MVIRLMTVATVLMLLACLMIGASIAWAGTVHAAPVTDTQATARQDAAMSSNHSALPQQADPDSAQRPYQETLV
jgi:hypothetical protein